MRALSPARVKAASDLTPAQLALRVHQEAETAVAFAMDQVRAQMATLAADLAEVARVPSLDTATRALCVGLASQIDGAASRLNGIHGPL